MQELFEDGTILWRANIPVRTSENLPTICTYVLATNPERAREVLEPLSDQSLFVRTSAYTKAQVAQAHDSLARSPMDFHAAGEGLGPGGDIQINVFVPYLTPELLDWANAMPSGLVNLTPWLRHDYQAISPV
ncbi:hypothetical protein [Arthrobacter sp.]|uniref:hypothetical protein n=1 Tax=Arthrobacter sp. TaxID=1667 RepID=UPI0028112D18|nr:hypothetical protein [Arthrobacter sp.]